MHYQIGRASGKQTDGVGISDTMLGWLRFHYDNEYENDNEISLSFSLRFCKQRDERLIASISSTTTITNRNLGITQEMKMSAHTKIRSRTRCRCRSGILTSLLIKIPNEAHLVWMLRLVYLRFNASASSFTSTNWQRRVQSDYASSCEKINNPKIELREREILLMLVWHLHDSVVRTGTTGVVPVRKLVVN